jgi:hypothetical protein
VTCRAISSSDLGREEFDGGHDGLSWRGTVADGLIQLMGNVTLPLAAAKPARVVASPNKRLRKRTPLLYGKEFVAYADRAKKLLSNYRRHNLKSSPRSNTKSVQLVSPAIHVFDRYDF